jgi:hypothetical protein
MGERMGCIQGLVGISQGKKPLGRPRRRWDDNIKWFFQNCDGGLWTEFIWLRIGTGGGIL